MVNESVTRNHVLKTLNPNHSINDFQTGRSDRNNYTTNSSKANFKRRPYTSVNRNQDHQAEMVNNLNYIPKTARKDI